ncbi:protein ALP1-like [Rutidosis leptorrhynchoides]|uniref:protein ALP1-like n=1 Tax=Rutidosis leptorrhynchoides TaxID=125765 RepID=UPI003A9A2ABD
MGPKRNSNKGKAIMEYDDNSPRPRLVGSRVTFSKQIHVRVSPPSTNVDNFKALFKVTRVTFNYICSIVQQYIISQDVEFKFLDETRMSIKDQIAIALRRLCSIELTTEISDFFGTKPQTVLNVTWLFVVALGLQGEKHLSWSSNMGHTITSFQKIGGLINCCGAIATTNLKTYPHIKNDIAWLDPASNSSVLLQAVVGPDMRFLDIFMGVPGSMTSDTLLKRSKFYKLVESKEILNGQEIELDEKATIREYVVGDSGFQLLPWLITPYNDVNLSNNQIEFNKRHRATRSVARRALNKLKEVWGAIDGGKWIPGYDRIQRIILACCILHNIVIDRMEGDSVLNESMMSSGFDLAFQVEKSVFPDDEEAVKMRDNLCLYLNED